ncbi:MAG: hypothetical protein CVU56_23550 [Deltaproteobacteria bacterium HGW-Deltaproteobacteria-14]|jgi:hypothetical protein|nr:MAG: hypothetical protein CVU56_23550 [Deltaproteobacteria bacterium HGW-Deltaproteobacteria-14]
MLKSSLRALALSVTAAALAVGVGASVNAAPPAPALPTAADPKPAAPKPAAAPVDYNGAYKNSGGATLTIRNFVATKGFEFQLTIKSDDDCDGVDYSAAVKFTAPDKASNGDEDAFILKQGAVNFEPSADMIGMDCARVIDTEFKKK